MKRTSRLVGAVVLGAATIASGPVAPAFSATGLITLEAEAMPWAGTIKADATASGGRLWCWRGTGSLSASVAPPGAITSMTVRARG